MHHLLKTLSVVLAVQAIAAHSFAQDKKTELEGTWVMQSSVRGVKSVKHPAHKPLIIIKGNKWFSVRKRDGVKVNTAIFTVDASKSPKHIDVEMYYPGTRTIAPKLLGIYKIEYDTLTIRFTGIIKGKPGPRPLKLNSPPNTDHVFSVAKRQTK